MDREEIERRTEEEFNQFLKESPAIIKQIMDIFEGSGIPTHTAYLILKKMVMGFEEASPAFKYAARMANIGEDSRYKSITDLSKSLHKRWNKGKKANTIFGIMKKDKAKNSKRKKCIGCKEFSYYSIENPEEVLTKNPEIICPKCAIDPKKKYRKEINQEQLELIFTMYPELKTKEDEPYFTFTKR